MSKRLIRIPREDIFSKLNNQQKTEIHVVLRDGVTYFGKLQTINPGELTILDTRDHTHHLSIDSIHEILLDTTAKLENILNK